jgi:signal transduction histidine kinase
MRLRLKNHNQVDLYNEFTADCNNCINTCASNSIKLTCPIYSDERRIGKISNELGEVFCCSENKDFLASSKSFKAKQESILFGLKEVQSIKDKLNIDTQKLIHNLTKTNGHNIQELYAVVPQEILANNLNEQLEFIKETILKDPIEAAKTFLRIAKNNAAMKVEFSVINKLTEGRETLRNRRYRVKKVTLNLFHIFFQDFKDKDVYVQFEENDDYLIFDYEIIHVALYHLIHNATKYIRPKTTLFVRFVKTGNDFDIKLEMSSLRIEPEEKLRLLEDGFSGKIAKKLGKSGKGIGLGTTAKILELNHAELIIETNVIPAKSVNLNGINYDENIFIIRLKNYAQQAFGSMAGDVVN